MDYKSIPEYDELEKLQDLFNKAEHDYYKTRYAYWTKINKVKKLSPLKETYKQFEGRVRRDVKKRMRQNYYGKRPRGHELDHSALPVLFAYVLGITDLDIINSKQNCVWIPKRDNRQKGIKRHK